MIGEDNAIARHGIHGLYWLFSIKITGSMLMEGENIIFLSQSRSSSPFQGVMYDYIRLEAPISSCFISTSYSNRWLDCPYLSHKSNYWFPTIKNISKVYSFFELCKKKKCIHSFSFQKYLEEQCTNLDKVNGLNIHIFTQVHLNISTKRSNIDESRVANTKFSRKLYGVQI